MLSLVSFTIVNQATPEYRFLGSVPTANDGSGQRTASTGSAISCGTTETPDGQTASRLLKIGRYEGSALNVTANDAGKAALDVKNIDSATGIISVHVYFYEGLSGQGKLIGTVSKTGKLMLVGKISEGQICIEGTLGPNVINATYRFASPSAQNGTLEVGFAGEAANNTISQKYPLDLIGKWLFDDYSPPTRSSGMSPNRTASYSKRLTVEFFEDGTYKYIETNRLCPTGSTGCRHNNQLEKGNFSITQAGFNFAFRSGDVMHTDDYNPRQNAIRPMKTAEAHLIGLHPKWAIGPTGPTEVLTFCVAQDGKTTCFQRME